MTLSANATTRFWNNVLNYNQPGKCWEWRGYRNYKGYGRCRIKGTKLRRAHRVAWMLANGSEPPPTLFVCHKCDNPPCCNPEHLFLGNHRENMADKVEKARRSRGTKPFTLELPKSMILRLQEWSVYEQQSIAALVRGAIEVALTEAEY